MAHYYFETDDEGEITRVLKDGQPHDGGFVLEQAFAIVRVYFKAADKILSEIAENEEQERCRMVGLNAFLMSMTGLEAFTNVYFHLRALDLGSEAILTRLAKRSGGLRKRITELLALTPDGPLIDQDSLMDRLHHLVQLRNSIVHPAGLHRR
jgi:hypothetical protein